MSSFSQYDTDEERLPESLERVGYDADTERYTYRDTNDGSLWQGPEGARYGRLERISGAIDVNTPEYHSSDQVRPSFSIFQIPSHADQTIERGSRQSWRYMMPFLLLIFLFLLGVWKVIGPSSSKPSAIQCGEAERAYEVRAGDTCWALSEKYDFKLDDLKKSNPKMDCDSLLAGEQICLPPTV
ncbi:hypothetical protein NA57DRAFT_74756 [Rhizodiscina lignyota]|uniref:LysM domain-containing protein n=1 Tax=Rhizodiscina lignyota TaxID=1504668 RepID=A0A9P4M9D6_9PEZI|nr:hypothetical protein NA57DRAFT_74756 [Rhizodiscina lignyota]